MHLWSEQRGVTLLDTVIGSALMLIVFAGIASVFQLSVEVVTNNRIRAGAIALGNERMEYLRSLSYPQIGVIGGIPAGNVPQEETVSYNNVSYTRRTMVVYMDDPGDGFGAADQNNIIADYKTIRVEVNWQSRQGERGLTLVGRVSPFAVETAVPGGILTINVVNDSAAPVSNVQVDIINTGVVPAIDIRTYSNANGSVTFIGAPAASDYQITVSKTGYSQAQTYPVTVENPNPNPRHLTVANDQTTTASFTIDYVATKTVETYMQIQESLWTDTMIDATKIAIMSSTTIAGGVASLSGSAGSYDASGVMQSVLVAPASLNRWNTFSAGTTTPSQTGILFRFYANDGVSLIPETQLPGNAAGFATSTVDLSLISTSTYPALKVTSLLSSSDPNVTPSIDFYSFAYDYGPDPFPNLSFGMRGAKTIGNSPTIYKYDQTHSSGASSILTLSNVEADTYTLSVATSTGYLLVESCSTQPEILLPGFSQTTKLYVLPASNHSLLIDVRSSVGMLIEGASVRLTGSGYDTIKTTSSCGQTFFGSLATGSFTAQITKNGYQDYTTNVDVSGGSRLSIVLNPQ